MGPAATQQKSKTFSPSSGRMLYPSVLRTANCPASLAGCVVPLRGSYVVRICHALHHPGLPQSGEIIGLQVQFLGVDFDVMLAELGRETTLAQRRGAGPYERSQHGQRVAQLRMWHLLKILPCLELGVVRNIVRGGHWE